MGAAALVAAVVVPVALSLGGDAGPSRGDRGVDPAGDPTLAVDTAAALPFLQGSQVAVVASTVSGADQTLDASFKFRYAALSKS